MNSNEHNQPPRTEPRFFYGYIVAIAAFCVMFVSYGLYGTFGIFFKPLLAEFGWTRAMISGAYSLSMILHGVLGIIMGGLSDKFGPRLIVTFCGFFLGLGYLLMSQVNTGWQLYVFYGVIIGIGMSGIWIPLLSAVARWFTKRRSLMSGIVIAGAGIGSFIIPPLINWLIAAHDWRLSYIILGIAVLFITIVSSQFLKRDPIKMGQRPYGEGENTRQLKELQSESGAFTLKEAIYTRQFWSACIILLCFGFCMVAIKVHIVPHVTDIGMSAASAANILAVMGGAGILGNYVLGGLGDRIGNRRIFFIGFILTTATSSGLLPGSGGWILYLFAAIFGFAFGGMATSESPLVAGLFGLRSHGLIYGVLTLGFTTGASVGPLITGYIFDVNGSYRLAFVLCAAFALIGLILAAILRPPKRL